MKQARGRGWKALCAATAVAFVGLLAMGAHAVDDEFDDDDRHGGASALLLLEALGADLVTPSAALEAARARAGDSWPFEVELEVTRVDGKGRVVWDFDFLAEEGVLGVAVDARTGEVVHLGKEADDEESTAVRSRRGDTTVDLAGVLATLGGHVEGLVLAAAFEAEDDEPVEWEAELVHAGRQGEVEIDPASGKIVIEDDADDDDDDDEDEDDDRDDD